MASCYYFLLGRSSRTASSPFGQKAYQIILLGDRDTCPESLNNQGSRLWTFNRECLFTPTLSAVDFYP